MNMPTLKIHGGPWDGQEVPAVYQNKGKIEVLVDGSYHLKHVYLIGGDRDFYYIGIHGFMPAFQHRYLTPQ